MEHYFEVVPQSFKEFDQKAYSIEFLSGKITIEKEINRQNTGFDAYIIVSFFDSNKNIRGQKRLSRADLIAFFKAENENLTDAQANAGADNMIIALLVGTDAQQLGIISSLAGAYNYVLA